MLRQAPYLKKGDKIALVSTARKITAQELELSIRTFESWGLVVVLGKSIGASACQFAGSDEERIQDFQTQLDNPEIKAIICARGGYGTHRILDHLDFNEFMKHPCWIVGYSDVTVLHSHVNNYLAVQTLHSTMPISFKSNTPESISTMKNALFGEAFRIQCEDNSLNRKGSVEGIIQGGNLSILYSILGTKSGFNPEGEILFIEDLDEYLYHVDRMMLALKRAGKLAKLKALIVGGMSDMNDNAIPFGKNAQEIIAEHVAEYDYPVCFDFPTGHTSDNRAIIFGSKVKLEVAETTTLWQLER